MKADSAEASKIEELHSAPAASAAENTEVKESAAVEVTEEDLQIDTSGASKPTAEVKEPAAKASAVIDMSDDDEDDGLEFYDPQAEERERQAKKLEELQRNQQAQLGSKPMTQAQATVHMVASLGVKPAKNNSTNSRLALMQQLESARL